ncbi:NAD(+) diphosphatase [Glutamicibacter sp.]|uniref:NAD(+) diphosphatase n=1 Tax=Glutamicibacter sp. TaxID=1931995 RepID=UPI0028BDAA3F|nr:NAD(+) diphosphatase [Glutamicibacter sp.]
MALAQKYRSPLTGLSFAQSLIERPLTEQENPELITRALQDETTSVVLLSELGAAATIDALYLVPGSELKRTEDTTLVFLGTHRSRNYILAIVLSDNYVLGADARWISLREGFTLFNELHMELFVEAQAISNWLGSEKFCPRCGSPVKPSAAGWNQRCEANGHQLFPRTDPAVIASIIDEQDRILLGANANFRTHMYSVLAGFVEAGESLESAVRREIFEEAGVHIGDVAYRGSQPWPLPRSLMLGFSAEALSTDLVPDGAEIRDLRWFSRAELEAELRAGSLEIPRGVSIAYALIKSWYGQELPEAAGR